MTKSEDKMPAARVGGANGGSPRHAAAPVMAAAGGGATPQRPRDFLKVREPILHRVIIAGALAVALLVGALYAGVTTGVLSGAAAGSSEGGAVALTTHGFLEVTVRADGWDEESTPAICRIRPSGSDDYLFCRAVPADVRDTIELDEGAYYISWITPVGADGTLYIPPEEELVQVRAGHTTSRTEVFTRVPVHESTFGDYAATIDIVYDAIGHGDDTLAGEAGAALMHKLQVNANAAPNFYIYIPGESGE